MKIQKKNNMSNYSMEVIGNKAILSSKGMFSKEDAENYIKDFVTFTRSNNTSSLILVIENAELKTSFPDVKPFYEKMSELYINSNFKKKYMLMPESAIAGMQIKKLDEKFFKEIKMISNINEAI
ncbi:hypothetical protein [Clostridium taeniosporum]|uniref:STAS/SEC14 domain-containing protein n=1 Tax=Clostridium taeniosporum TaxID=394958 RepID=A0A1D7XMN9_9CLOT|nr:hypothetical protein [Clostridium taeniosporum]AOR24608.1 hypothetical protein BGI42_13040 [Clostridium taeniosporum]